MRTFAVLVAYRTDVGRLNAILKVLAPQCPFVLADNSDDASLAAAIRECVDRHGGVYVSMGGNRGIGAAQNAAVETAWRADADAVLLLDDDSVPASDVVGTLVALQARAGGDAVLCARALDGSGREIGNVRTNGRAVTPCRELMSSGTLVTREIFERVGAFDESLFIDGVDFDWGWRARSLGVPILVSRDASITHRLGEGSVGRVRVASPVRHYYQYRNVLRLMGRRHTPWGWRAAQAFKLPVKLLLIALLMNERRMRLRYALAGIRDAAIGVTGKLSSPARSSRAIAE